MKAKFKIYKIKDNIKSINDLLKTIKSNLDKKNIIPEKIDKDKFQGYIFSNENKPDWYDCISELRGENSKEFVNLHVSYILFYKTNKKNIYAISGGQGYHILSNFIEVNFGLNLIPKLIQNNDSVVNGVVETRLSGNQISDNRINRQNTTLAFESDFLNIYKELTIYVDNKVLSEILSIDDDEEISSSTKIINKNFLGLEKSISIDEIPEILNNLDKLQEKENNFPLNPFKSLKKTSYSSKDVYNLMIKLIKDKNNDLFSFEIVGENISEYYDKNYYKLDFINLDKDSPILWNDIFETLSKNGKITKKLLKELFKSKLCAYDDKGDGNLDAELFNCLNGYIIDEKNDERFYLINGNWYVLEKSYEKIILEKFNSINNISYKFSDALNSSFPIFKEKYDICKLENDNKEVSENDYNEKFDEVDDVILSHKVLINNIEISDLIIYDKDKEYLFFICLKKKYDGAGARDLFGQIEASANCVQSNFIHSSGKFLDKYYEKLNENNNKNMHISMENFKECVRKGKICYVAGFLNNFRIDTTSYYIKILSYILCKKLGNKGFKFYLMNFNYD